MKPVVYTISQYYETPRASAHQYSLDKYPARVRGTPEYNPLYDTFQSDFAVPQLQRTNDFRPISPYVPRFRQVYQDTIETTYDRPRSYRTNRDQIDNSDEIQLNFPNQQKNGESGQHSEIDCLMDKFGGNTETNDPNETCEDKKSRKRRRILYNLFDFLAIVATCVIFALIYLLIKPVQRGFFCDDTSIQYPYRPDTIPMWLLAVYGGVGPIIIFFIVELSVARPFSCCRGASANSLKQRRIDYVKTIFHTVFLFGLGIAVCFLITEVGKRTIGRLRPYYLTVCNPIWSNVNCTKTITTASGNFIIPQYVIEHNCDPSVSEAVLQEAKLSFPSGHSSYSTYAFMFLFVYFEARIVCQNIRFLKPFLQSLCVAIAFFTCLSRVTDHKHHATDVIGGALIGFCIAIFTAVRVGTYLWSFSVYCETDNETRKDRLPTAERIAIPGIETNLAVKSRSSEQKNDSNPTSYTNRSNYDNVTSMQTQHRNVAGLSKSAEGRKVSPVRGYEEANV